MLEHYLYDILSAEEGDFNIIILEDSPIFKGHFPEYPVVPGVCLMQIIKELAEKLLEKQITLKGVRGVKFLSVVKPGQCLNIEIETNCEKKEIRAIVNDDKGKSVYKGYLYYNTDL
jgi:3-hydroxymyristoyl/3-hydroxydecanoyl-(acyl carrier protein) dehydratase